MPQTKFVVSTDFGDPVSALFMTEEYVVCGTLLGRIWLYKINDNCRVLLAGFSDDAIRGVYIEDGFVFATIGDQFCKKIRISDVCDQLDTKFDRRSSSSGFRYVLQRFEQVTIVYPGMTTFVNVTANEQSMCPYKIQQARVLNVCPLDAFSYFLLLSEFPQGSDDCAAAPCRKLKVVNVSTNVTVWEISAQGITFSSFLSDSLVMYLLNDERLIVCNFVTNVQTLCLRIGPVIAASVNGTLVTTLTRTGHIRQWDSSNGTTLSETRLTGHFSFSLGFPYFIQTVGSRFAVSSDYGLHVHTVPSCDTISV